MARALLGIALLWGVPAAAGWMAPTAPFDAVLTAWPAPHHADLAPPADGARRVVVLVHGISRSAWSLWRLERALESVGYEVFAYDYPSTTATIEEHAAGLARALVAHEITAAATAEVHYVGHSMGGLVIRQLLQSGGGPPARTCVFLGTPHRGARLCDLRKDWLLFDLFLGDRAALQLSPSAPFQAALDERIDPDVHGLVGNVIGGVGDDDGYHGQLPGDDDGTVTVAEAHLAGETDAVRVPVLHGLLGVEGDSIRQTLHFLRHGRFERAPR